MKKAAKKQNSKTSRSENQLGLFLKEAREKAGLLQRDVSEALGYQSAQFISDWERGLRSPPAKKLKDLVEMYGISAEQFYEVLLEEYTHQIEKELKKELGLA